MRRPRGGSSYALRPPRQTGTPSPRTLSARFSVKLQPGNARTPIRSVGRSSSLRYERRRLAVTSPTRRKIISVTLCASAERDATNSAPLDEPPCMRTMAACLARTQSSPSQIAR